MTCYPKEFLELQLAFVERVSAVAEVSFHRALLEYTNLYIRFGLGHAFDEEHPVWRAYLSGLPDGDARSYTYDFYLAAAASARPTSLGKFGCFSWGLDDGAVRLHFVNEAPSDVSPLDVTRRLERRAELVALLAHAKAIVGDAANVLGVSWLYNLDAYKSLFPPAYTKALRPLRGRFCGMSLWGQFLNHRGRLHRARAAQLLGSLAGVSSLDELDRCFPFQVLTAEAPVASFYDHYEL